MSKELALLDYCTEEARTTIRCGSCKAEEVSDTEALEAVDQFFASGWRVRKGLCYCPLCSHDFGILK